MFATRKTNLFLLVLTILCPMSSGPACAQIINGTITGSVTDNSMGVSGVAVGDLVTGTYSYDSSVVLTDVFSRKANELTAFTLDIGSLPTLTLADLQPNLLARERLLAFSTPTVDS